jgi:hypothetical protein
MRDGRRLHRPQRDDHRPTQEGDWDAIADLTNDKTWASKAMNGYFERLEWCGPRSPAEAAATGPSPWRSGAGVFDTDMLPQSADQFGVPEGTQFDVQELRRAVRVDPDGQPHAAGHRLDRPAANLAGHRSPRSAAAAPS